MSLGVGERFAGYTVVRRLGAGGMGEVYLAQHPRLPRREALKILRPDLTDGSFRERFIREADSIAALEHRHIVTVYDRGETEAQLWIATQYVEGADAGQLLRSRYPAGMPADEVADIVTAIGTALDYAHSRGLLHRDVKPANILLADPDPDGTRRIYLADFGIARPLDDPAGLTATNFTLGTVAYAAPEQLMGKALDGRADQYALAATAYHLLTGTPPFTAASNPVAVISQHLNATPPPVSKYHPELASLDAAFARALAKNPNERFPRCRDFGLAITVAIKDSLEPSPSSAATQQAPVPPAEAVAAAAPTQLADPQPAPLKRAVPTKTPVRASSTDRSGGSVSDKQSGSQISDSARPQPPVMVGAEFDLRDGKHAIVVEVREPDVWLDVTDENGNHHRRLRFSSRAVNASLSESRIRGKAQPLLPRIPPKPPAQPAPLARKPQRGPKPPSSRSSPQAGAGHPINGNKAKVESAGKPIQSADNGDIAKAVGVVVLAPIILIGVFALVVLLVAVSSQGFFWVLLVIALVAALIVALAVMRGK